MSYLSVVRSFLLQPYPFTENPVRKFWLCAGIGLFVALFLGVFKPFGFDKLPVSTAWGHAFLFGGVTFVVSSLFQMVLPLLFPKPFREEGWRSWKEIVYLLVTTAAVGAGNFFLSLYLYSESAGFRNFLWAELMTLQVGVFPVVFVVFLKQMNLYRRFATQAKAVTEDIREMEKEAAEARLSVVPSTLLQKPDGFSTGKEPWPPLGLGETKPALVLRGDNQKEALSLASDALLYIASADNYANVHYLDGGKIKSSLLRGSLRGFEEQLSGHGHFFRCHRMYIVNLQAVAGVSGNAQGLRLHLAGSGEAVPVSRNLTETVKERLHALSRSPQNA